MAVTALAGLILGIPTLRLRGDYLAIVTLGFGEIIRLLADNLSDVTNGSRGLNEVAYPRIGQSDKLPVGVFSSGNSGGTCQLRHLVVLAGADPHGGHPAARRQPRTQPGRPRLGGHPRGRGRRGGHGRQHLPVQAVGLRHRRGDRRTVRGAVRRAGAVRGAADVQHHQLDAVPVRGGARRPGQQARRHLRCVHHRVSAQPAARRALPGHQPRRPEVPVLRSGAGGADDLPPAGPVPGAPAAAGLRQVGAKAAAAPPTTPRPRHDRTRAIADRRGPGRPEPGGATSPRAKRCWRPTISPSSSAASPRWTR